VFAEFALFATKTKEGGTSRYEQTLAIDLARHPDPRSFLAGRVGELEYLRIVHLPLKAAIAALQSTECDDATRATITRLLSMRDAEMRIEGIAGYKTGVKHHFSQIRRRLPLDNGWTVGGPLADETSEILRIMVRKLRLHATPDVIAGLIEQAALIDPTAREWMLPVIADMRRNRTKWDRVPGGIIDGQLQVPFEAVETWVDEEGDERPGHAPVTPAIWDYRRRCLEHLNYEKLPVRQPDGTTEMVWHHFWTGEQKDPPRVPLIRRSVINGIEEWSVQEQVPTGAITADGKCRAPMWCMLPADRIWDDTLTKLDALDIALAERRRLMELYCPPKKKRRK
jgi:hypothetical protein